MSDKEEIKGDFMECSVAAGLKLGEFSDLPPERKQKLIKLMSRIAEKAYRRGAHQAIQLSGVGRLHIGDPISWRYGKDLSESPGIDGFKQTSLDALFANNTVLNSIGFGDVR